MSERQQIEVKVHSLARRKRWQLILDGAVRGVFWGALASGLLMLAAKLWILPLGKLAVGPLRGEVSLALCLIALSLITGAVIAALRKISLIAVANDVDVSLGLRERVSSALALDPQRDKQPFVKALVADAAETLKDLPLRAVYPWRAQKAWRYSAVALGVAAALSFVPQLNWFTKSSDRAEAQLVQESGKKVLELAKEVEKKAEEQRDPEMKEIAKEIKRVGEKLENQQLKKKEALKELERLKDKLETQARNQAEAGQKAFLGDLAQELKKLESTRELGEMLNKEGLRSMMAQMNQLMKDLQQGKMSEQQLQQLKDLSQALREASAKRDQNSPQTQQMQQTLDKLDQAIKQSQQAREQLQQSLDKFQQDLQKLTDNMQQQGMGKQAQQLQQQMQQLQQQMQQEGSLSQQSLEQMLQQLQQTQQQIQQMQQNGQLSQQQAQQLQGQCEQCISQLQSPNGSPGELGQANQGAQQGNQGLGQAMGQMGQGMGQGQGQGQGGMGMGQLLAQQIAELKNQLGYGGLGTQGQAASGWGDGTSPYAVSPAPAEAQNQVEKRQGDAVDGSDRQPVDFESLYEGQDVGHAFSKEGQLRGRLDLTRPPQKIDEVRSSPETQEALVGYADIIGSYAAGEENAISQEQVPQEYRELVKQYFDRLQKHKDQEKRN